jgi:hypothetical protein
MKIFCLFYKDEIVVGFPSREDCVEFGKKYYGGMEWDCCIKEMWLSEVPPPIHIPFSPSQPFKHPYTSPMSPFTPPGSRIIWCGDGSGPKAFFMK